MNKITKYRVRVSYRAFDFEDADDAMDFAQAAAQAIAEDVPIEISVVYELAEEAEADV